MKAVFLFQYPPCCGCFEALLALGALCTAHVTDINGQTNQEVAPGDCTYSPPPASNMLRRRFNPETEGLKGYKVQISSPISAGKGSSICPSLQSTRDLPLFIHKSPSLFIHCSHVVSRVLCRGSDVHLFNLGYKIASWQWPFSENIE